MPSLIDLRRRIRAVKNTQQITKAMKMVAASKLRRAQERIMNARPYAVQMQRVLGSVASRVGGAAQVRAMRTVSGSLRLDLSQYRELEAFAQFGSDLDEATRNALARGERMVALLNQPQYQPVPTEEQVAVLYAGVNGFLDDVPVTDVPRFAEELVEHLRAEGTVLKEIQESGDLPDELAAKLDAEIKKVLQSFHVEEADSLVG